MSQPPQATTATGTSPRYAAIAIGLHWAIAALLLGNIFLGWNMGGDESPPVESLFQLHKSIGITILFLTVARIAWRILNPPPELPESMPAHEKWLSTLVHVGFYFALLAMPLTGWVLVSISEFSVATVLYGLISWPSLPGLSELSEGAKSALHVPIEFIHSKSAWLVIVLLVLHVAGAVKHQFDHTESVLKRMIPVGFGPTAPPEKRGGAWVAFGGSAFIFLVIVSVPVILDASTRSAANSVASLDEGGNWDINYDQSRIQFSGEHEGSDFTGIFTDWTATISFSEDDLSGSEAQVLVQTGSASTGSKLYDDTLKVSEWFNVSNFPVARVTLDGFEQTEEGYLAEATLQVKEQSHTFPFRFTLEDVDGVTLMKGQAELNREALNLGMKSDASGDWVSLTIQVDVDVQATPKE